MSRQTAWGKRQCLKRIRAKAEAIEELIVTALANFLSNREQVRSMLLALSRHDDQLDQLSARCQQVGRRLTETPRDRLRLALRALVVRIELSLERVKIVVNCDEAERYLSWDGVGIFRRRKEEGRQSKTRLLNIPADAIRYGRLLAMPIEPRPIPRLPHPSPALKRLMTEARNVQALVDSNRDKSLPELAAQIAFTPDRFARVLRLNYLAPDIFTAILDGTHPPALTRTKLVNAPLPMDWGLQRRLLGFPERAQPEGGE